MVSRCFILGSSDYIVVLPRNHIFISIVSYFYLFSYYHYYLYNHIPSYILTHTHIYTCIYIFHSHSSHRLHIKYIPILVYCMISLTNFIGSLSKLRSFPWTSLLDGMWSKVLLQRVWPCNQVARAVVCHGFWMHFSSGCMDKMVIGLSRIIHV